MGKYHKLILCSQFRNQSDCTDVSVCRRNWAKVYGVLFWQYTKFCHITPLFLRTLGSTDHLKPMILIEVLMRYVRPARKQTLHAYPYEIEQRNFGRAES